MTLTSEEVKAVSLNNSSLYVGKNFEIMDNLVNIVAHKYTGWYNLSFDDVKSNLWIDAMKFKIPNNQIEGNEGWIVNCLKMDALRDIKKVSRRYETQKPVDTITDSSSSEAGPSADDFWFAGGKNLGNSFNLYDILSIFNEGTREYTYINLMLLEMGMVKSYKGKSYKEVFGGIVDEKELSTGKGHTRNMLIASVMGFASPSSSSFKSLKYRVKEEILSVLNSNQ